MHSWRDTWTARPGDDLATAEGLRRVCDATSGIRTVRPAGGHDAAISVMLRRGSTAVLSNVASSSDRSGDPDDAEPPLHPAAVPDATRRGDEQHLSLLRDRGRAEIRHLRDPSPDDVEPPPHG